MRSMWLIVDDGSFDENPVGWEDPITVDPTGHTYSPLHADDEVYEIYAPDGYVGAHRA